MNNIIMCAIINILLLGGDFVRVNPNELLIEKCKHVNSAMLSKLLGKTIKVKKTKNGVIVSSKSRIEEKDCVAIANNLGMVYNGKFIR